MKHELSTNDIALIIAQARKQRSDAAGDLIVSAARQILAWLSNQADRLLHTFPASATKAH